MLWNKWNFFNFKDTTAYFNKVTNDRTCLMWSFELFENTIISSKYTSENCHFNVPGMTSFDIWNVTGELLGPKGMQMNLYKTWWEVKAVL